MRLHSLFNVIFGSVLILSSPHSSFAAEDETVDERLKNVEKKVDELEEKLTEHEAEVKKQIKDLDEKNFQTVLKVGRIKAELLAAAPSQTGSESGSGLMEAAYKMMNLQREHVVEIGELKSKVKELEKNIQHPEKIGVGTLMQAASTLELLDSGLIEAVSKMMAEQLTEIGELNLKELEKKIEQTQHLETMKVKELEKNMQTMKVEELEKNIQHNKQIQELESRLDAYKYDFQSSERLTGLSIENLQNKLRDVENEKLSKREMRETQAKLEAELSDTRMELEAELSKVKNELKGISAGDPFRVTDIKKLQLKVEQQQERVEKLEKKLLVKDQEMERKEMEKKEMEMKLLEEIEKKHKKKLEELEQEIKKQMRPTVVSQYVSHSLAALLTLALITTAIVMAAKKKKKGKTNNVEKASPKKVSSLEKSMSL